MVMQFPRLSIRVEEMGSQIAAQIRLHHADIEEYVKQGVDNALRDLPLTIAKLAADEASKRIAEEIRAYFGWGEGAQAIRSLVKVAVAPFEEALKAATSARENQQEDTSGPELSTEERTHEPR